MTNFAFLWAAREGNIQSKKWEATFFLRYVKKDKMADGTPRRLCVSHSPFNGAEFLRKGDGSFEVVGRTHLLGSRFGTNTKLLRGVFGPISMPNDYLNTVFDDVVSLWGSRRNNAFPRSPILSLRAWKESLRNMVLVDRPLKQKHIHLWIVRRASNAISRRNKIETCRKLLLKKVFCNTKINDNNLWRFRLDQISHVISLGIFLY